MKLDTRSFRFVFALGLLALFAAVVIGRYAMLAGEKGLSQPPPLDSAERGPIMDREGRLLAVDSPLYNIAVWKPETDKDAFPAEVDKLASILDMSAADILSRWKDGASNFFYLRKRVAPQVARAIQDGKTNGAFSGIVVERVPGRLYPEKRLASHLVGFVGDANRGLTGIENKYDQDLLPPAAGKPGQPDVGNGVVLTIDADLQYSLEAVARRTMDETKAQSVILLAADVLTGEILAYVAMPDFDPNDYLDFPETAWYDWPSVYAYEPGSVFKVFSMASVLDLGAIDMHTTFVCGGAYRKVAPSGEVIVIKDLADHGIVDVQKILEYSCNSGAAQAADRSETVDFYGKLCAFGFGTRTGLTVPGESPGSLRSPETWSLRSKPTIAIGQEILVTADQMLAAATAVADGGILRKLIVVKRVVDPDGATVYENQGTDVRRVVSETTARNILTSMESGAGLSGTGFRAKVSDVTMAVKTGTAQMIDPLTHAYSDKDFIASTLAIFPADAPRIALYGVIVKPVGEFLGGRIAAPMIRDAAEAILEQLPIERGGSTIIQHGGTVTLPRLAPVAIGDTMPDLSGVPKRLLLPLLQRDDLKVKITGDGWVAKQSPPPGSPVSAGMSIELELK
ncbi:MAG TPA: penicillin-binding protein [Rectinemataceae bacterium]|nr:penicillin-binding protein [Rectinemataceae bacterium]